MRRSSAPSAKRHHGEPLIKGTIPSKCVRVSQCISGGPLRDFHMMGKEDDPDAPVPIQRAAVRKKYAVLWNRPNTKKHKTWEGDGVVEVTENTVYLRNSDGVILTSMLIPSKDVVFEEGMRLTVGSKEVEILEEIVGETEKAEEVVRKLQLMVKPQKITMNVGSPEVLLLPDPPEEHQRIFKQIGKPMTAVRVVESIAKHLRPHQKEGVIFLYKALMGFHNPEAEFHGAVLADEMGLGKSLQVIATCFTLLRQGPYAGRSIARKILIISPSSLVENWSREVNKWLGEERVYAFVVDGKHKVKDFSVSANMPFIILSYDMVTTQLHHLKDMIFDVVVYDEGHRLKNNDTKIVQLLNQMECKRRVILTGTPIQNDLHEFFCLVSFVQPDILGTYAEYRANYEIPILNSQASDACLEIRNLGEEKVQELNMITSNMILRRTQMINKAYLPGKEEVVVFCKASQIQNFLLERLLEMYNGDEGDKMSPFKVISLMRKICNHPVLLEAVVEDHDRLTSNLQEHLSAAGEMGTRDSGKLTILDGILTEMRATEERIVVVSHSTKALDIIEGLCKHLSYVYCRLDGSTSSSERQKIVDKFNSPRSEGFIFLLSSKAGGTGLNLVGASRLVLFDGDWNPATDLQAMSRIWRDGQTRDVIIYRLITAGTIEERIFQRQCAKNSLIGFMNDSSKDSISFSDAELKDIFTLAEKTYTCLTHEALECLCDGDGNIPEPHGEVLESVRMNNLMQWEHHARPINLQVLEQLSLGQIADEIVFLFRNQSSSFSK